MSYTAFFELAQSGPADPANPTTLSAQLRSYSGGVWADSGALITTGFDDQSDANNRFYVWPLTIPPHFSGDVVFRNTTGGATDVIGVAAIAPAQNGEMLRRVLGLVGENRIIQPLTRDTATGETKTGAIRLYDTQANATADDGATGLLENYPITGGLTNGILTNGKTTRDGS